MQSPASGSSEGGDARYDALLDAALDLAAEHDLDQVLQRMVRCAADVAGARFAALGVYDDAGRIERFVHRASTRRRWRGSAASRRAEGCSVR